MVTLAKSAKGSVGAVWAISASRKPLALPNLSPSLFATSRAKSLGAVPLSKTPSLALSKCWNTRMRSSTSEKLSCAFTSAGRASK